MNNSFYTALCAVGKLKFNSIFSAIVSVLVVPIGYVCFKLGLSPVSIAIIILIDDMILSFVVKPIVLIYDAEFKWSEISKCYWSCLKVTLCAIPIPVFLSIYRDQLFLNDYIGYSVILFITMSCLFLFIWTLGISKVTQRKMISLIKLKISKKYGF